jgi:ABC-type Fe3+ transport system permease subunit
VSREVLGFDVAVAIVLAALVLIFSPGVAVAGMIALLVLLICLFSAVWQRRRVRRPRRQVRARRRTRPRSDRPRRR